jgi:hypothetical protein
MLYDKVLETSTTHRHLVQMLRMRPAVSSSLHAVIVYA